jgi:hypothetical protein
VGVPELALDRDQRNALVRHRDSVRVPQLVLVPTSAQPVPDEHSATSAVEVAFLERQGFR